MTNDKFPIPEKLLEFLSLDKAEKNLNVTKAVICDETKGKLISETVLAEEIIDSFLTRYWVDPRRVQIVAQFLRNELTFHKRIELLKQILLDITSDSDSDKAERERHIQFLQALKKLRNQAAHCYGISPEEVEKLARDSEAIKITSDPNYTIKCIKQLESYLNEQLNKVNGISCNLSNTSK
jgi:hypothetical protein